MRYFFILVGKNNVQNQGRDSERGDALSLRDSTPYRPKGSPSVLIWCQYILILRGSTRQKKKRNFFVKIFQVPKNGFLFKNLPAAQTIWPQQCLFSTLGELGKSIWSTLKKPLLWLELSRREIQRTIFKTFVDRKIFCSSQCFLFKFYKCYTIYFHT